jgi:hypothetical protein
MGTGFVKQLSILSAASLLVVACGSRGQDTLGNPPANRGIGEEGVKLSGGFSLLDGSRTDLNTFEGSKPTVVYFVSDTCTVCSEETEEIVKKLGSKPFPSNVNLVSIVVGAIREDAAGWKESHTVGWPVGFQAPSENASLLRQYCPAVQTPCVVVSTPEKGVVFAENGRVPFEKITALTGEWL